MTETLRIATFNLENLDEDDHTEAQFAALRPMLARLRADVLCLQEVHGQERAGEKRALHTLTALLAGTRYEGFHIAHTLTSKGEAYDKRNLVVASRFPVTASRQLLNDLVVEPMYKRLTANPPDAEAKAIGWERPIFHVTLDVAGRALHVLDLHLKSKLPVAIPGQTEGPYGWKSASAWAEGSFLAAMKRAGQAIETRRLVDEIFDTEGEDAWIAVCGDFNADADEVPVTAIRGPVEETGNAKLARRVLVACENSVPKDARYSLLHLGRGYMLDHVLASRALLAHYVGAEIHNEALPDESGAFRTDRQFPEPDHAPVVAEFVLA
jgi:endonuclease/exonuclease/phosphatase family metal-dependent hydrolase